MSVERRPVFGGLFEVSSDGHIFRVSAPNGRTKPKELAQCRRTRNYKGVTLWINGKGRPYLVHQLVLLAFQGPCPKGLEVAHLNGVETDNRVENLAYVTRRDNHLHKWIHGRPQEGERNGFAKLRNEDVQEIRREFQKGASQTAIARKHGIGLQTVHGIVRGKRWQCLPWPE